ncbi:hypothetical protein BDC45DRAFT_525163, partial [Circinella umbellata]
CIDVDEEWDGPELYQYFEREFLRKREKWSQAWHNHHHHDNTNNYIETWHRQLKEVYLPSLRRQRVDVLVYILWGLVLPDLMQDHLCTVAKFRLRTMNKAERTRLARVNELNGKHIFTGLSNRYYYLKFLLQTIEEEAAARIVSQECNTIKVLSFTDENITYDVLIDADDDFIVSCTCSDNQTNDHHASTCIWYVLVHAHNIHYLELVNRDLNISLIRPTTPSSLLSSSSSSSSQIQQQQQLQAIETEEASPVAPQALLIEAMERYCIKKHADLATII